MLPLCRTLAFRFAYESGHPGQLLFPESAHREPVPRVGAETASGLVEAKSPVFLGGRAEGFRLAFQGFQPECPVRGRVIGFENADFQGVGQIVYFTGLRRYHTRYGANLGL